MKCSNPKDNRKLSIKGGGRLKVIAEERTAVRDSGPSLCNGDYNPSATSKESQGEITGVVKH